MSSSLFLVLILAVCSTFTTAKVLKFRLKGDDENTSEFSMMKKIKVDKFMWMNCGGDAAGFTDVELTPDPLKFPGTLSISAKAFFNATVMSPLATTLLIEKQVGSKYIKLPCIDNFGSCMYDDLCELLDEVSCPDPLVKAGIPCQCPFKVAQYTLPKADFDVYSSYFPTGGYHLRGTVSMNNKQAGCLDIHITVA